MLKTFLKPGWVLFLIFIVAFSYLSFTVLAPWQLNKDAQIVERNHLIEEAYDAEPQPVTEVFSDDGSLHKEWERAELTGHYLPEDEVLLRLRPVESAPGFQSLVPFETESGETFLVNRGWMPTDEGNSVPHIDPAPEGEVTIVGMARYNERKHTSAPIEEQGYTQVYSINTEQIAELVDVPLAHDYLQLSPEQPGELHALPVPKLDRGNHLSYGYQWIAFGVMAPLGFAYFVWSEIRERRRARDEDALIAEATAAATGAGSPDAAADVDSSEHEEPSGERPEATAPSVQPSTPAAGTQPSRRSRSRYGSAKPDFYEKIRERGQERY